MSDWNQKFSCWLKSAMTDISVMLHCEIEIESFQVNRVSSDQIAGIWGNAKTSTVGIYQRLAGATNGYIMIIYQMETAQVMLEVLFGKDLVPSKSLMEIRQSAICELCNLIMKSFITTAIEVSGSGTKPSLPVVLVDSADSIEGIAIAEIRMTRDNVFIIDSVLQMGGKSFPAKFVIMLCDNLLRLPISMVAGSV